MLPFSGSPGFLGDAVTVASPPVELAADPLVPGERTEASTPTGAEGTALATPGDARFVARDARFVAGDAAVAVYVDAVVMAHGPGLIAMRGTEPQSAGCRFRWKP